MADRHNRVKSLIARNISEIVAFELKKASIGMVSVNDVEVYDDYSVANVYVYFIDEKNQARQLEELKKTEGFVRSSLAKRMDTYKVPKVRFLLDESYLRASRLEEALKREEAQLEALENEGEEK